MMRAGGSRFGTSSIMSPGSLLDMQILECTTSLEHIESETLGTGSRSFNKGPVLTSSPGDS